MTSLFDNCKIIILLWQHCALLRSLTLKSLLSCSAWVFKTKQLNPQYSILVLLVEYCGNQLMEIKTNKFLKSEAGGGGKSQIRQI